MEENKELLQNTEDKKELNFMGKPDVDALIGISNELKFELTKFNLKEWKALAFILKHINFKETLPTEPIYVDKKELAEFVGIHGTSDNLSSNLKRDIIDIVEHSVMKIDTPEGSVRRILIDEIDTRPRGKVKFKFNPDALPYFGNLTDGNYVTMLAYDFHKMRNINSIMLYEFMRKHLVYEKGRAPHGEWIFYVKQLKKMFKLEKETYTNKTSGHFKRSDFENRVLIPILEDIQRCIMIKIIFQKDNESLYEKVEGINGGEGYHIQWEMRGRDDISSLVIKDVFEEFSNSLPDMTEEEMSMFS